MGRKELGNRGPVLDTYRKRIGKQDYKKSKDAVKDLKAAAEARKSSTGLKDIVLVAIAFSAVLAFLYVVFYMSLTTE